MLFKSLLNVFFFFFLEIVVWSARGLFVARYLSKFCVFLFCFCKCHLRKCVFTFEKHSQPPSNGKRQQNLQICIMFIKIHAGLMMFAEKRHQKWKSSAFWHLEGKETCKHSYTCRFCIYLNRIYKQFLIASITENKITRSHNKIQKTNQITKKYILEIKTQWEKWGEKKKTIICHFKLALCWLLTQHRKQSISSFWPSACFGNLPGRKWCQARWKMILFFCI